MKRTVDESQFVMQTLLVQLTQETRNVTFVLVTMVSKAMDLCATVWEQFQLITVYNLGLLSIQLKFVLYDVETMKNKSIQAIDNDNHITTWTAVWWFLTSINQASLLSITFRRQWRVRVATPFVLFLDIVLHHALTRDKYQRHMTSHHDF